MTDFIWSDLLINLVLIVLAVLYATGHPEPKRKPKKIKRDYRKEWESL